MKILSLGFGTTAFVTEHARGNYQRNLLTGSEAWDGSTLRGRAKEYGGRYADSRAGLIARWRGDDRLRVTVEGPTRWPTRVRVDLREDLAEARDLDRWLARYDMHSARAGWGLPKGESYEGGDFVRNQCSNCGRLLGDTPEFALCLCQSPDYDHSADPDRDVCVSCGRDLEISGGVCVVCPERDEQESEDSGEFSEDGELDSEVRAFLASGRYLGLCHGVEV